MDARALMAAVWPSCPSSPPRQIFVPFDTSHIHTELPVPEVAMRSPFGEVAVTL